MLLSVVTQSSHTHPLLLLELALLLVLVHFHNQLPGHTQAEEFEMVEHNQLEQKHYKLLEPGQCHTKLDLQVLDTRMLNCHQQAVLDSQDESVDMNHILLPALSEYTKGVVEFLFDHIQQQAAQLGGHNQRQVLLQMYDHIHQMEVQCHMEDSFVELLHLKHRGMIVVEVACFGHMLELMSLDPDKELLQVD